LIQSFQEEYRAAKAGREELAHLLEAHISGAVGQQGAKAKLLSVCVVVKRSLPS